MKQKRNVIDCYNKTAKQYAETFFGELSGKPLDRLLLRDFAMRHSERVLDVGCGCGHTTRFLYESGSTDILGVDLSTEMVREASAKNRDLGIQFQVDNILETKLPANRFSGVVAFYAVVHFTDEELDAFFRVVHELTRPRGELLFSFHIGEDRIQLEEFLNERVDITFNYFLVESVLKRAKKANWNIDEVLMRYPYEGKEYPSQRAYIRCIKE